MTLPFDPDPIIEDLTAALDKRTAGAPVHPDELDNLAEFTVGWFEQRGYLPQTGAVPVLYLLTDRATFLGLHQSLTDAQMNARTVVARRGRAATAGDPWVEAIDCNTRVYRWLPVHLGAPVADFLIREVRVS